MIKLSGLVVFLILWLCLGLPVEGSAYDAELSFQRQQFLQAEKARDRGHWQVFQTKAAQLKNYPLYPYLVYSTLMRRLTVAANAEVESYIALDPHSPLAANMRRQWLLILAKRGQWDEFLSQYQDDTNQDVQCEALWARWHYNHDVNAMKAIPAIWIQAGFHPRECRALFEAWMAAGGLEDTHVWTRLGLAMKADNPLVVNYLRMFVSKSDQAIIDLWFAVRNNPYIIKNATLFQGTHPFVQQVWFYGFNKLLQTAPDKAIMVWKKLEKNIPMSTRTRGEVIRKIALKLIIRQTDAAENWLNQVPDVAADPLVREWRIRFALIHADWPLVLKRINALPPAMQDLPDWQYWRARALEAMRSNADKAKNLYRVVATNRNYYGFLASEQLDTAHSIEHRVMNISAKDVAEVAAIPGIMRAREFYALGRVGAARHEWDYALRYMDERQLHAAARLASQWSLPDRAILTSAKAENQDDLEVRFPFAHKEIVLQEAQKHSLNPAWIFAVTRQESAFMDDATSSAGALGLMQLMPYTAKHLGRELNISVNKRNLMYTPINIRLGSFYLKKMLVAHKNNIVLATAAYNAGPGRVSQWLSRLNGLPTDVWVEVIPFDETREYLKRILTYTVIYAHRLGQVPALPRQFTMDWTQQRAVRVAANQ